MCSRVVGPFMAHVAQTWVMHIHSHIHNMYVGRCPCNHEEQVDWPDRVARTLFLSSIDCPDRPCPRGGDQLDWSACAPKGWRLRHSNPDARHTVPPPAKRATEVVRERATGGVITTHGKRRKQRRASRRVPPNWWNLEPPTKVDEANLRMRESHHGLTAPPQFARTKIELDTEPTNIFAPSLLGISRL